MPGADVDGLLRSGIAALCLVAGALHMSAAADHEGMAGHVAFFVLVALAQSALGAALLWSRQPGRWLAAAAAANLAVAAVWVLSRTTGLPVDGASVPEVIGWKDGISSMLEIGVVAAAGLWWLLPEAARRAALGSRRLASTVLGTGIWALGAAGLFAGHTHSPGHTHSAGHGHAGAHADDDGHTHEGEGGGVSVQSLADAPHHHGADADDHDHALALDAATDDPAGHHHEPDARAVANAAVARPHDHGPGHDDDQERVDAPPVAKRPATHRHSDAADPPGDPDPGDDDTHSHDHGSGANHHSGDHDSSDDHDRHNDDGTGWPLDGVLKLIQPR
jgi:hypothetical protein